MNLLTEGVWRVSPILEGGRGSWDTCMVKLGTEVVRSTCTWPLLRPPPRTQKWSLIASSGLGYSGWGFLSLSWGHMPGWPLLF